MLTFSAMHKNNETATSFSLSAPVLIPTTLILGEKLSSHVLHHPSMQIIMANRSYDLVIVDIYVIEAIFGLGQHFGAPTIGVSAYGQSTWTNDLVGNPAAVSMVPSSFSNFSGRMTLWQRFLNLLVTSYERLLIMVLHHPIQVI